MYLSSGKLPQLACLPAKKSSTVPRLGFSAQSRLTRPGNKEIDPPPFFPFSSFLLHRSQLMHKQSSATAVHSSIRNRKAHQRYHCFHCNHLHLSSHHFCLASLDLKATSFQNAWFLKVPCLVQGAFLRLFVTAVKGGDCVSSTSAYHLTSQAALQGVASRPLGDVENPSLVWQMDLRRSP